MLGNDCPRALRAVCRATCALLLLVAPLRAQDSPSSVPPAPSPDNSAEVRALTASILELKSQLKSMSDQLAALQKEQERARVETRELQNRLDATLGKGTHAGGTIIDYGARSSGSTAVSPSPDAAATSPAQEASPNRASQIEENQQFLEAKINEQYQTKVESSSKYRVRLSGIALLNVFANRGRVDNQDFPQLAASDESGIAQNSFGGSLRQSQLGLEAFGPEVVGAHTSADLKFDFAGGFPATPNGVTTGIVRLRTGVIRMDWAGTSFVAGQDRLFFSPLAPTSLASLAIPALAYNGNLWSWTPQVRLEHTVHLSEGSSFVFQGGILDPLTGQSPSSEYNRVPTSGEGSGQPAYAARWAWRQRSFGQQWMLGFGGYYSRQNWGSGRAVDSWVGTTDLSLPLGRYFGFTGQFYRGRAVGGLGGGIGQSIVLNGPISVPSTMIQGLNSMGGWAQLKFQPRANLGFNSAFGQDNPFASQFRQFPFAGSYLQAPIARSRSFFLNSIYQLRSDFLLSLEYRRLRTFDMGGDSYDANHINLSLGYVF